MEGWRGGSDGGQGTSSCKVLVSYEKGDTRVSILSKGASERVYFVMCLWTEESYVVRRLGTDTHSSYA